ncbi:hypothetical protein FQA39_LY10299 [Lamprigera yunnana]|nr:hypothetical protein FQA39_LY10299 [Lamprigera yunnana]
MFQIPHFNGTHKLYFSGPELEAAVKNEFPDSLILTKEIVPDDQQMIFQFLMRWSLKPNVDIILTTGGTGFSSRDVTPEATRAVIDKEAPGISYAMISKSMEVTKLAILSRAVCGIKNQTLIINLPGSVKGATECFGFIKNVLPHAVAHLRNNRDVIKKEHSLLQNITPSKVKVNEVAFRNRSSPYPMIEVGEALEMIFSICSPDVATEIIDISQSLYRVLAEDVLSNDPIPPFNASIKDGYAVRVADGSGIRVVRDAVCAGDILENRPLAQGEIVRISTGAAIPEGADAVVQIEDTSLIKATPDGSKELEVEILVAPNADQDIRSIGSEIAVNEVVLNKGDVIGAGHIGVLATVGKTQIEVYKRASVAILSTGNELLPPHEELRHCHIRDSNKLALLNLLNQYSFAASDAGIAKDNPDSVKRALSTAFYRNDVVITTGGVSMGEFDVIKNVLVEDFRATIHFGRINMKPGKPTTFATCTFEGKRKIIFGLPGNPVSAMVTTILFVLPTLRHLENNKIRSIPMVEVVLGEDFPVDVRPEYARVQLIQEVDKYVAYSVGNQISSKINSFVKANALLYVPSKRIRETNFKKGETLNAMLLKNNM